ncbi:hypothetical protein V8B97DRAFT_2001338 [Scleroderma yunnanense]
MIIVPETKQEVEHGTAEDQGVNAGGLGVHNSECLGADSRSYIREPGSNHPAHSLALLLPPLPPPPPYNPYSSHSSHPLLISPTTLVHRQSPLSRFLKAFLLASLLYILILGAAQGSVRMAFRSHGSMAGQVGAEDGTVVDCINSANWGNYEFSPTWPMLPQPGRNYPHGAHTKFTLPVDVDALYLFARGAYQHGHVRVVQSDTVDQGTVHVDVRAAYYEERALSRVTLCRLTRGSNEHGIGIYTPVWGWTLNHRDQVQFQVTFTFPAAPAETPLRIKRFETETGLFSHSVGNLYETMFFDQISITTSNSNINVESITLEHGTFKSSNGYITGHYNASRSLKLVTTNEFIKATVSLLNGDSSGTELEMRTSNRCVSIYP